MHFVVQFEDLSPVQVAYYGLAMIICSYLRALVSYLNIGKSEVVLQFIDTLMYSLNMSSLPDQNIEKSISQGCLLLCMDYPIPDIRIENCNFTALQLSISPSSNSMVEQCSTTPFFKPLTSLTLISFLSYFTLNDALILSYWLGYHDADKGHYLHEEEIGGWKRIKEGYESGKSANSPAISQY
jgi:hypothetical protein